jgi:hypothetical protein
MEVEPLAGLSFRHIDIKRNGEIIGIRKLSQGAKEAG